MKKIFFILILVLATLPSTATATNSVNLKVPFTSEIPDGIWVSPWSNACEEAAITMVENYYAGEENLTIKQAKQAMSRLFGIENKIYGFNADTNAALTARLINDYSNFTAKIKINPTLEEIKDELRAKRPVISFHYGKNLPNPEHRWRAGGSYYHVMTINGFDDTKKEFVVNDSASHDNGLDYRYTYATIMDTLADFNHKTKKTYDQPTVIFTSSKLLVKSTAGKSVYLINHDIKNRVTSPELFKVHGWKWSNVKVISQVKMDSYKTGQPISK
ncbi:MAG: C39 family peptidase [bacterium]|nr:C39 family peptidase [bacterium]